MKQVYFDNAASAPMWKEAAEEMYKYLYEFYGNPSSVHDFGRKLKVKLEKCRKTIANIFNASPYEIIFTSGATEGNNWILRSAIESLGIKNIITSPLEHNSVYKTIKHLSELYGINVHYLDVDDKGNISISQLKDLLKKYDNVLVSLMYVNNELGNLYNIKALAEVSKQYGAYFHTDAVQAVGVYKINLQEIPVDFLVSSAHKFGGPKGVGFTFKRESIKLNPMIVGGSHEFNYRAGTENLAGIVGMTKALQLTYEKLEEKYNHLKKLKILFVESLRELPGFEVNGNYEYSSPAIVNVSLPPVYEDGRAWLMILDINGIAASSGSACSSGTTKESHVLAALNLPRERRLYSVRFSFGPQNTEDEVKYVVDIIKNLVKNPIKS